MVTLTPSSRNTRSSGRGRKSGTTLGFPRGSSVYLIFSLIDSLSFTPIACTVNTDYIIAVGESNRDNAAADPAKAVVPPLARAMGQVFRDDTPWVGEGELRYCKGHPMFFLVLVVLARIPLEPRPRHLRRLAQIWRESHTVVWLIFSAAYPVPARGQAHAPTIARWTRSNFPATPGSSSPQDPSCAKSWSGRRTRAGRARRCRRF